jgi:hypothetical protein
MWDGAGFTLSLSRGEEAPRAVRPALVEKIQVLRGAIVPSMHVEEEKPLSPDLKSLESGVREPSGQRARGAHGYALLGGAPRAVAPLELGNDDHRSTPGKPLGLMWCGSLLSVVHFR